MGTYTQKFTKQEQIMYNFLIAWHTNIPANFGLVLVYAANEEYFAIKKEAMNRMVDPAAYLAAKTIIELPMMLILGICATGVSLYGMMAFDPARIAEVVAIEALLLWDFDCMAQLFAVQFANPLAGMLQFMNMFFAAFLFSEFFIPQVLSCIHNTVFIIL